MRAYGRHILNMISIAYLLLEKLLKNADSLRYLQKRDAHGFYQP